MRNFINKLRNNPWPTSLVILVFYILIFSYPAINSGESFGRGKGLGDAKSMIDQLPLEISLVISLTLIISVLRWWREIGFKPLEPGGLKFTLLPLAFSALVLAVASGIASENNTSIINIVGNKELFALIAMTLLIGIFEELLFRGILFHGASNRFKPITVVFITSALFGAMHFVNYIVAQPLPATLYQMLHAAAVGIMYGALILRLGTLWPLIILHGLWDFSVSILESTSSAVGSEATSLAGTSSFTPASMFMLFPPLVYGMFVLWRWSKWNTIRLNVKTAENQETTV